MRQPVDFRGPGQATVRARPGIYEFPWISFGCWSPVLLHSMAAQPTGLLGYLPRPDQEPPNLTKGHRQWFRPEPSGSATVPSMGLPARRPLSVGWPGAATGAGLAQPARPQAFIGWGGAATGPGWGAPLPQTRRSGFTPFGVENNGSPPGRGAPPSHTRNTSPHTHPCQW